MGKWYHPNRRWWWNCYWMATWLLYGRFYLYKSFEDEFELWTESSGCRYDAVNSSLFWIVTTRGETNDGADREDGLLVASTSHLSAFKRPVRSLQIATFGLCAGLFWSVSVARPTRETIQKATVVWGRDINSLKIGYHTFWKDPKRYPLVILIPSCWIPNHQKLVWVRINSKFLNGDLSYQMLVIRVEVEQFVVLA